MASLSLNCSSHHSGHQFLKEIEMILGQNSPFFSVLLSRSTSTLLHPTLAGSLSSSPYLLPPPDPSLSGVKSRGFSPVSPPSEARSLSIAIYYILLMNIMLIPYASAYCLGIPARVDLSQWRPMWGSYYSLV